MNKPESLSSEDDRQARPVFVSYATADRKEALSVCKAIERRGVKCWISTRDVRPGENYQEAIVRSLRDSRAMVLVFSDAANNSDEIKKELSLASRYRIPVMALRIEDVEPSDAFAYELSTRQWIDAFENWDRSIDTLVGTIGHVLTPASGESSGAPAVPRRRAKIGARPRTIAAAATAAANLAQVPRWAAVEASAAVRCGLFGASTYPKSLSDQTLATYLESCSETSPTKSLDLATKVVAAAPDFSWGWSAVENAAGGAAFGEDPGPKREAFLKQALAAADKAIQLDPSNSEAYTNKSYLIDPTDLVAREALVKKGIASRPLACGCEHHIYGNFLMDVGRAKDAVDEYNRATDVLPLNGNTQIALGEALIVAGYPEQSKKRFDAAVDLVDHPELRDEISVMTSPLLGQYSGIDSALRNPKVHAPAKFEHALEDAFHAMQSGSAQAKSAAAAELVALPPEMTGRLSASLLGALGDYADALKQTEARLHRGDADAATWLFYPSMRGALSDPAFPATAQRMGLMRYWKVSHTKPDVCSENSPPPFCSMI